MAQPHSPGEIEQRFQAADRDRQPVLERARRCSLLSLPSVLPPSGQSEDTAIRRTWQSLGARGTVTTKGKMLLALFAPGMPWFGFQPSPSLAQSASLEQLEQLDALLYARELQVSSLLDSSSYRVGMSSLIEHCLVTGNAVGRVESDYSVTSFRFDNFVWERSGTKLIWVVTREQIDPLQLIERASRETLEQGGINVDDMLGKQGDARPIEMFSMVELQEDGKYSFRQEAMGIEIHNSTEKYSPIICVGYEEISGEKYSRSFIEEAYDDLLSFNSLTGAIVQSAEFIAKNWPAVDPSKGLSTDIFKNPNGTPFYARVSGGQVDGVGVANFGKGGDLSVAANVAGGIEKRLGQQFLLDSAAQPTGDRVTATQVQRVAQELDGARGHIMQRMADELQRPYIQRVISMMERDSKIIALPSGISAEVNIIINTGIAALARQINIGKLMQALQVAGQFPGAAQQIKFASMTEAIFQGLGIDTRRYLKSEEEMQAELQRAQQAQMEQSIAQQTIQTTGAVVESAAKGQ